MNETMQNIHVKKLDNRWKFRGGSHTKTK